MNRLAISWSDQRRGTMRALGVAVERWLKELETEMTHIWEWFHAGVLSPSNSKQSSPEEEIHCTLCVRVPDTKTET